MANKKNNWIIFFKIMKNQNNSNCNKKINLIKKFYKIRKNEISL